MLLKILSSELVMYQILNVVESVSAFLISVISARSSSGTLVCLEAERKKVPL